MKQKLIGGAILAALLAIGFGGRTAYVEIEIRGCQKAIISSLEAQYGEIPDDIKAKVLGEVSQECRKVL